MTLLRLHPLGMDELRRDLNRLLNVSHVENERSVSGSVSHPGWVPSVDITETAEAIHIDVDVPGVQQADLQVNLDGTTLVLNGIRRCVVGEGVEVHRQERSHGEFQRVFNLPVNVWGDRIKAILKDGVLRLVLPKIGAARPKQIPVTTAD